ncbi:hypothetical protein TNCV_308991 [Trichonephila clavipes]|nr:hypothetical protein TNCV_308991 [Trichonephila clavipes]
MLKISNFPFLISLDPGQQVAEDRSKLDCWNSCNLIRKVLLQFLKTMGVVAINLRLERCVSFLRRVNGIYSAYCGCSELVVGVASRGKLADLDAFDNG